MDYTAFFCNTQQQAQKIAEQVKRMTPTLDPFIVSQLAMSERLHRTMMETIGPQMKAITLAQDQLKGVEKEIDYITKIALQAMGPLRAMQKEWLTFIQKIHGEQKTEESILQKVKLIRYEDGKVIFECRSKKIRKKNSQHLLLLEALLFQSDERGFISYEDIENYFVSKGIPGISNRRKSHKRIWDARVAIFRFLGILAQYKGKELIKKCEGKGLMLYNPDIDL